MDPFVSTTPPLPGHLMLLAALRGITSLRGLGVHQILKLPWFVLLAFETQPVESTESHQLDTYERKKRGLETWEGAIFKSGLNLATLDVIF